MNLSPSVISLNQAKTILNELAVFDKPELNLNPSVFTISLLPSEHVNTFENLHQYFNCEIERTPDLSGLPRAIRQIEGLVTQSSQDLLKDEMELAMKGLNSIVEAKN